MSFCFRAFRVIFVKVTFVNFVIIFVCEKNRDFIKPTTTRLPIVHP